MRNLKKQLSDRELFEALEALKEVPPRTPAKIKSGKDAFMFDVAKVRAAVSPRQESRHTGWISNVFIRKESRKMSSLGTLLLVISLILGGSGITAVSAQSSLPDSIMYPVKLFTEDIQFGFTNDPYTKWELSMRMTEERMEEIRAMLSQGSMPSEATLQRLNTRLTQTLHLATNVGGEQGTLALTQTQTRLETQSQLMLQVQTAIPEGVAVNERVQQMIQERIRQTQTGVEDPVQLQQQLQQQTQQQLQQQLQQQTQQQLQQQIQTSTPSGNQNQYSTPQMPVQTAIPPGCSGQGQCGNEK
jgi:hypothetical protein